VEHEDVTADAHYSVFVLLIVKSQLHGSCYRKLVRSDCDDCGKTTVKTNYNTLEKEE
jgi:hypothetical protein